jgi:uncharacterized protein YfaS (alpha-2-macroglobulin family)
MTRSLVFAVLTLVLCTLAGPARAQDPPDAPDAPAFSLSSSQIFSSTSTPEVTLTFERLSALDFRVYKVRDPFAFFAGLKDPHVLGSPEYTVPQERTWIERIAAWKASRRTALRTFLRRQASARLRAERRARDRADTVQRRVQLGLNAFAQVPLLNEQQVVTTWREMLPNLRDTDVRRVPIEVTEPGVYVVEAVAGQQMASTVVIVSDVALVTKTAPGVVLAYLADRGSGAPTADCDVRVLASQQTLGEGRTGTDGVMRLALASEVEADEVVAVARCGTQVVASAPATYTLRQPRRELVGHVYTDRPIYRPGHTAHIKAVLRWREDHTLLPFDRPDAEIVVTSPGGDVVHRARRPVDRFGALDTSVPLAAGAALGAYTVAIHVEEARASSLFEVQEYRKPEFEVSVTPTRSFARQGDTVDVVVSARYYFGQPVRGARVSLVVQDAPYYSPLRWVDTQDEGDETPTPYFYGGDERGTLTATLDERGQATLRVPVPVSETGTDVVVRAEARVRDASDLQVSQAGMIVGTFGDFLIASRTSSYMARPGTPVTLRARTVDYRGTAVPGVAVAVDVVRSEWNSDTGTQQREVVHSLVLTTGQDGRGQATFDAPSRPGSYRIVSRAASGDRTVTDEHWLWVPGASESTYESGEQSLELVSDKGTYAPGDVARIALRGDRPSPQVLLTKEARTLTWHAVRAAGADGTFEVPITDADIGDTWVHVLYLEHDKVYYAERRLRVPPVSRVVQVEVTADRAVYKPGQPGVFSIRTLDAAGQPVAAQVTLGVVDEAVYGVKPDATPDGLRTFYRTEYSRVTTDYSRQYYFVGYAGTQRLQLAARRRPLSLADFKADVPERPQVRKEFPDAIYWKTDVVTGDDGRAEVRVDYPDSLTTWRLTARAVTADTRLGATVVRTTTTRDLLMRIVAPRFLTERDAVELPTVTHNYLPSGAADVTVTMAATGVTPDAPLTPRIATVATNGEVRHEWPFTAASPGTAVFTGTARTGDDADALEVRVPVLPYGARRERGRSGAVTPGAPQVVTVDVPAHTNPVARTIQVSVTPSLAGSMLGALDYLVDFPYGCTEQTVSSFVPNLLVMRTLTQLGIAPSERMSLVPRTTRDGLRRLLALQHDNGAWGWWATDDDHPFMTAYATYALLEARAAEVVVPEAALRNGIAATGRQLVQFERMVPELRAYLVYVLTRAAAMDIGYDEPGFDLAAQVEALWTRRGDMSSYGQAWLLLTLHARGDHRHGELAATLANRAETQGELAWWSSNGDPLLGDWGDASVDTTATVLRALAAVRPDDPLVDRALRWLLANRRGGSYWMSTKQTAMVLYGLLGVLEQRRHTPVPVTVTVEAAGRQETIALTSSDWTSAFPRVVTLPAAEGANAVTVRAEGGTAYWSVAARYYDTEEGLARSGTRRLALSRKYFALAPVRKGNRVVYEERPFSGSVAPGDLVLVRLVVAGSNDWQYLMVEDPLPAGAEAVNDPDTLELAQPPPWTFGSHREYRDDRVALFLQHFDGRAEFAYLLRATTPGRFRAMPAQVTPMYVPDEGASSAAQTFVVSSPATSREVQP